MSYFTPHATSGPSNDTTNITPGATHFKLPGRTLVKPILKKLSSHSNSDRGSFDFDAICDDLPSPLSCPSADYESSAYADTTASGLYDVSSLASLSDPYRPRDVSFSTSASTEHMAWRSRIKYSHVRSTSGTSHTSSIATTVSARNGTFVHPFQQIPRAATPPLSYTNSIASLETSAPAAREYAATINEDDDVMSVVASNPPLRSASLHQPATSSSTHSSAKLSSRFRGPSLDETHNSKAIRDGFQTCRPSLLDRSSSAITAINTCDFTPSDAGLSPTLSQSMPHAAASMPSSHSSHSSHSPLSPLRSSFDISGFRLRSRSEVETRTHQEQVRDARRKYQEREKAKDEKYARQQLRRKERAEKDAENRQQGRIRKSTTNSTCTLKSSTTTNNNNGLYTHNQGTEDDAQEKLDLTLSAYDDVLDQQTAPCADEVQFQRRTRRKTAKHKTNNIWTAFMLWLRTRLLRLAKH